MEKKGNLEINSFIVLFLTTIGSGINYICQILMGRIFSIENYGIVNTIFSMILITTVVGNTACMLLSKYLSKKGLNGKDIYNRIIKFVLLTSLVIVIMYALLYPVFIKMLDNNPIIYLLSIVCLITSIFPILYQGVFGGLGHFIYLGLYTLIVPVSKILSVIIACLMHTNGSVSIYTVISSIILGNVIALIIGMDYSKKKIHDSKGIEKVDIKSEYYNIMLINIIIMYLMNLDVLYFSYCHNSKDVGLYSSVLMFGKIIYYFVTAIVTVMLPSISRFDDITSSKKMLKKSILYTLILTILFIIPVNIFSNQMIKLIYGVKYLDASMYVKYACLISISYSLNIIILNFLIGLNRIKILKYSLIIGAILSTIIIGINSNYKFVLLGIFVVNIIIFIVNSVDIYFLKQEGD